MNEFNNMGPQYNSSGSYISYPQPPNTGFGPRSPMQMPTAQKGITTVTTITSPEAVDSYPVAAGQTAVLMHFSAPNEGTFWLKTTDIYGRELPTIDFEFKQKIHDQSGAQTEPDSVSKKDFEELKQMVSSLYNELHN